MNNKTLALLFSAFAAISVTAQATKPPSDVKPIDGTKKPTCMQELQKGKSVQANMTASIKCQERAIGRLAMAGILDGDNLKAVMDKQKEFDKAFATANKDKKISGEEKKELQALRKAASGAVFETAWNEEAMTIRLDRLKKSIYGGETKGQLTAGEMTILVKKYNELEARANKLKADGLTTAEKKKLHTELSTLSKLVYDDKRDHEGNVAPTADREKDNIDETRRNLAASVVSCFSDGKNGKNYWVQFTQLQTVHKKEGSYLADGVLSKEERADLGQLYKQARLDIAGTCGEKKPVTRTYTSTSTATDTTNDAGVNTSQWGIADPAGPKSDVPADPSKKVGSGL